MSADRPSPFTEGRVLGGRYRIERVLGEGGMGIVALAHHMHLDQRVAMKFILPERAKDATVVERFLIEARAAAKIRSEHVVRVFDAATLDDGTPYIVMEYVEGEDLGRTLQRGPLDLERAASFILQASEALAEAHALGIVHRDLKPANLFLTRRPDGTECIKVLDFGISKLIAESPPQALTSSQHILGSPPYMSPEQLGSSKAIDQRTDLWSLGVTFFELVTGKRPFEGGTLAELSVAILTKPPIEARSLRPELPALVDDVIAGCLEKQPALRFASLAELANELAPLAPAARASVERIERLVGEGQPPQTASIEASALELPRIVPPEPPRPRPTTTEASPGRWVLALALMLGVLATAALIALVRSRSPAPEPPKAAAATALPIASSAPIAREPAPSVVPPPSTSHAKPPPTKTRADEEGLAGENPFK